MLLVGLFTKGLKKIDERIVIVLFDRKGCLQRGKLNTGRIRLGTK